MIFDMKGEVMRWGRVGLALVIVIVVALVAKPLLYLAGIALVGWLAFGYATGRFSRE